MRKNAEITFFCEASAMSAVLDRFLTYVSFDTQSDPTSPTAPSTNKQLKLAQHLVAELKALGIENAHVGHGGIVYAVIEATPGCEANPPLGFNAHMDTSPDASGTNVKPQIIHFEGADVLLNSETGLRFPVATFPEILKYRGEDIIFTDGTTLLGADDKGGIAAIVTMAEYLVTHPEAPHARIHIAFTPDEEIGRGTENLDRVEFAAQYAYTIDGGELGLLQSENFNAASATLSVTGIGVHPGSSKDKMVNAARIASIFVATLPEAASPEHTEDHEGFLHPAEIAGDVVKSHVDILIRDHDKVKFEEKKAYLRAHAEDLRQRFPKATIELTITDSYENMRPYLDKAPKVLQNARNAFAAAGVTPIEKPVRGGTDGAVMSARGLPCPNIFTGGMNFHGIYEYLPVKSLEKAADVTLRLALLSADVKTLA